ncbi:unnamed protein product [Pleuronectes platessa]|uniref:Uncharacterized protein n=1 Tax=Pleuronectes platessa TaxID=8262 RepID=A0A9N7VWN0_PLEPL|nr:unnamed protein product [Pleuronectes platessa]
MPLRLSDHPRDPEAEATLLESDGEGMTGSSVGGGGRERVTRFTVVSGIAVTGDPSRPQILKRPTEKQLIARCFHPPAAMTGAGPLRPHPVSDEKTRLRSLDNSTSGFAVVHTHLDPPHHHNHPPPPTPPRSSLHFISLLFFSPHLGSSALTLREEMNRVCKPARCVMTRHAQNVKAARRCGRARAHTVCGADAAREGRLPSDTLQLGIPLLQQREERVSVQLQAAAPGGERLKRR